MSAKWFLNELPHLRETGVVDPDNARRLEEYYQERMQGTSTLRYFVLTMSILGGVLISAGIVLLCNYNWDMFTKPVRIGISALPLMLGAVLSFDVLGHGRSQGWREFAALLTATGDGVLIAMLSQIYHTGGTLAQFMLLVLATSLPLIYIFNSISLATLYSFGLFLTCSYRHDVSELLQYLLLVGILPCAFFHLRSASPYRVWMRYLILALSLFLALTPLFRHYMLLPGLALPVILLLGGWELWERREGFWRNPWLPAAFLVILGVLACATSSDHVFASHGCDSGCSLALYWVSTGGLLVVLAWIFPRMQWDTKRLLFVLAVLLTLLPFAEVPPFAARIVFNVMMAVLAITLLLNGVAKRRLLVFNGGMLMLATLILCRFFDRDIGLLWRSAGFIALGVGFIAANVIFVRCHKLENLK